MATDAIRHRARVKAAGREAKERREKIALVAGVVILGGLLALEGPKTLSSLHGSKTASAPAPVPAAAPAAVPAAPAQPRDLRSLRGFPVKDPFVPQLGATTTSAAAVVVPNRPPAVRSSHFVVKDPFVQQISAGSGSTSTATKSGPTVGGGYIVMLASVYVGRGHHAADREAAKARAHGVPNVGIVLSDQYPTLRTGFYAVYSGPYPTLGKALTMLETIRGHGYVSAYTRRLAH